MSTRSTIAVKTDEGKFLAVYCHWDGYPTHNGVILNEKYNTTDKVAKLVAGGDMSSLADSGKSGKLKNPVYYADRGEAWSDVEPVFFDTAQQWTDYYSDSWCEYYYLWNGKEWLISKGNQAEGEYPEFNLAEVAIQQYIDVEKQMEEDFG
jgi:hypothetical protein|tara:strand:- start:48 stop:497 length:450 start_codon:yes stop_codon:yes gene_type:complete